MDSLIRRLIAFACRRSIAVFAVTAVLSAFFAFFATRLQVDPNVESLIPENAEIQALMDRYRQEGVSGEYLVVAVESADPFELDKLAAFGDVLDRLEALPEILPGITPFNLMSFEKQGSRLAVVPMSQGREAPRSQEELGRFVARITTTPYAENLVISKDATVLAAFFPTGRIEDFAALMGEIRGIVAPLGEQQTLSVSGCRRARNKGEQ